MDYKKQLLLFLYENNSKSVEIHQIFSDGMLTQGEIRTLIKNIKEDGLIETHGNFRMIGNGSKDNPNTVKSLHIKARIKPPGEQYVREAYMKKNEINTFNVDQFVNVGGDNHAPILQTKGHSSSSVEIKKMNPSKQPPKTLMQTLVSNKNMKSIVITVLGGLILYLVVELIKHYL